MRNKIYISGGITNVPDYKEKFKKAEEYITKNSPDSIVVNPACLPEGLEYKQYIDITLEMLKGCQMIYMLSNYCFSNGAMLELHYAQTVGIKVIYGDRENASQKV